MDTDPGAVAVARAAIEAWSGVEPGDHLVTGDGLRAWKPGGYTDRRDRPRERVTVLTPPSTVAAMRAGWRPLVHPSADPG
jgi:hypothetical protein